MIMKRFAVNRGFTLIETMVAIAILTIAVTGPMVVASRAMVAAEIAQDQLTASYLAQEGIEYVRMMRDDEYLAAYQAGGAGVSTNAWNNFLNGSDSASVTSCRFTACMLDPAQPMGSGSGFSLQPCSGSSCTPLYLAPTGVYTEQSSSGTATPFTRTIEVINIPKTTDPPGNPYPDKRIISTVSWKFHGTSYSVTITDHLTPWQ